MKTLKSLFMLCAGLSFCACSSDEDVPTLAKEGAVEITIVPPTTRALGSASSGDNSQIKVVGDMYVKLTDGSGSKIKKIANGVASKKVKFWGVNNPQSVEVWMNGGEASYDGVSITASGPKSVSYVNEAEEQYTDNNINFNMQALPASIPVYGSVDADGITLIDRVEEHNSTNYQMYTATVNLEIPVARLEVSAQRTTESAKFSALNLKGVYLDNIKPTNNGAFTNYKHPSDNSTTVTGQTDALLSDTHDTPIAFVGSTAKAPGSSQYYTYNFYGWDGNESTKSTYQNPEVKFFFTGVVGKSETVPANQYAIIKAYKNTSDQYITLQNGKIYTIENITLIDDNVEPVESGDEMAYAVEVTVTEAVWTIETTTGEWANPTPAP